jgi:hypothetical protein
MKIFWLIIITGLLLLLAARIYIQKKINQRQQKNKATADLAVAACLHQMTLIEVDKNQLFFKNISANSHPIARFWGRKVNVFSYRFTLHAISNQTTEKLTGQLNNLLKTYAKKNGLTTQYYSVILVVSDCWLEKNIFHLEVAYVNNQETANYLIDIKRAENAD